MITQKCATYPFCMLKKLISHRPTEFELGTRTNQRSRHASAELLEENLKSSSKAGELPRTKIVVWYQKSMCSHS